MSEPRPCLRFNDGVLGVLNTHTRWRYEEPRHYICLLIPSTLVVKNNK